MNEKILQTQNEFGDIGLCSNKVKKLHDFAISFAKNRILGQIILFFAGL
jgi:hypothetical protein